MIKNISNIVILSFINCIH